MKINSYRILKLLFLCLFFNYSAQAQSANTKENGLRFTENKGQIADLSGKVRPDVLYKGNGGGTDIYLRKTGISYVYTDQPEMLKKIKDELSEIKNKTGEALNTDREEQLRKQLMDKESLRLHRVDMDFVNCNSSPVTIGENEVNGHINYYLSQCPAGITDVKQYNKVTYKNLYTGIDVVFYGKKSKEPEYDFIVHAGADVNRLKLSWTGAEDMYIKDNGNLVVKTSVNEFYVSVPKAYQQINGVTRPVNVQYILTGSKGNNGYTVSLKTGSYDHSYPLTIDPLTWITYFGGTQEDLGLGVAVDRQHNVVFCGYTESPDLPVSAGAYDVSLGGFSDGWIAKFDANGNRIWATYVGGSAKDECRQGIAIDTNNNIFVTSVTWSSDFPTMAWGGAYMQLVNGATNNGTAYVARFTPAGALTWSTFYGGSSAEWGTAIAVDASQNIIITGNTSSNDFPTQAPYQAARSGGQDVYIVKFDNTGVRQWATYYGGSNTDASTRVTTDANSNIYVSGTTSSANFPVVAAWQNANGGGPNDAFLVKLNTNNGNPVWSTYYGGSGDEQWSTVETDAAGDIFLGLGTSSANAISTAGSFQPAIKGNYDGAVVKFTNAGSRVWGTYIGGSQQDQVSDLAVDINNNLSVAGSTKSNDFPVTACAFETTFGGSQDMILSKFTQSGQRLCSTYIHNTGAFSVANDGVYAYIIGGSNGNLPVTPGAFQSTYSGTLGDASFVKLCSYSCDTTNGVITTGDFSAAPAASCTNQPVNFTLTNTSCDTANTTYIWNFTGGTPSVSTLQNPSGVTWNTSGTYPVTVTIVSPCDTAVTIKHTITVGSNLAAAITPNGPTTFCYGYSVTLTANAGTGYLWSDGETTQSITVYNAGNYSVIVSSNGCSGTSAATTVIVRPLPPVPYITPHGDTLYCSTDPAYVSYQWYDSSLLVPGATGVYFIYSHKGNYNVEVTDTDGCKIAGGINLEGINEYDAEHSITLYPNPVKNELLFKTDGLIFVDPQVYIINIPGEAVLKFSNITRLDVSSLAPGMYFLKIADTRQSLMQRFIKEE